MKQTRSQMTERQQELTARLAAIRADLARGLDRDSSEQAIQLENMEVLQEIYRLAEAELQTLDRQIAAADDDP
jgi:hypothetical protein